MAIPVAVVFDLIDPFTAFIALGLTVLDTISMITYLCHDDEASIDASEVYELVQQRRRQNESDIKDLKLDISSDKSMHLESSSIDGEQVPNIEMVDAEKNISDSIDGFYYRAPFPDARLMDAVTEVTNVLGKEKHKRNEGKATTSSNSNKKNKIKFGPINPDDLEKTY